MKKITFIETNHTDVYDINNYDKSGFYINNHNEVVFVNKNSLSVFYICFENELPVEDQKEETVGLSEDFVIKLIAATKITSEKFNIKDILTNGKDN